VVFPFPEVLIRKTSLLPFPKESVPPKTIYPPSEVSCTELATSKVAPPKVSFHCCVPLLSVFIR
jgi:hypothetical protein